MFQITHTTLRYKKLPLIQTLNLIYRSKSSNVESSGYAIQPTTMKIQKFDTSNVKSSEIPPVITKYSTKGFTIQGNKVFGSIALLPSTYFSWRLLSMKNICIEAFQLFTVVEPRVEILVIGTGDEVVQLPQDIKQYLKKYNIAYEILDTKNACSTFNFLLDEHRIVGGLLIPPSFIPLF